VLLQKTESADTKLVGTEPSAIAEGLKAALVNVLRQSEADVAAATR